VSGPRLTVPSAEHEQRVSAAALSRVRQRRRREPPAAGREALERLQRILEAVDGVSSTHVVDIPGDQPPWQDGGVDLTAGEQVSTFAVGRIHLAPELDMWMGPDFQLWGRVGDGRVFRGTRASNTFTAATPGRLRFASYFPGEWADADGRLATPPEAYAAASGTLHTLVVTWAPGADPATGLATIADQDASGLVTCELDRLAAPVTPPGGWRYLWLLGDAEVFAPEADAHIGCHTHGDVGILQHDVDVELTDATRLQWSWRVDELPSTLPEDTLPTHDYLSIALEFDNGQDLTWQWSSSLPVEHAYRCPIPTWAARETHIVVRSGTGELGRWLQEDRAVARDYAAAVGEPPRRIVRVWLIAVSVFQRQRGACSFGAIQIVDGDDVIAVTAT
jgi:hypothetical protein